MSNLYLWINILVLLGPLALSFDKKVAFFKTWKALFPSILIMMAIFIPWDMIFTKYGVWGFNEAYLTGINIGNLPLEECLFFLTVPYACTFIYACVKAYFNPDFGNRFKRINYTLLGILFFIITLLGMGQYYSFYTTICAMLTLIFMVRILRDSAFWSNFMITYAIAIVPFMLVNGILTGTGIEDQIVWYHSEHIFNLRIATIPVEDSIYNFAMLLMTVGAYECFNRFFEKKKNA